MNLRFKVLGIRVNDRRRFIKKCVMIGGAVMTTTAVLAASACSGKKDSAQPQAVAENPLDPCGDLTGVDENDLALRKKLGYVKESPIPGNECANCNLYLPPKAQQPCGTCLLFKGPVYSSAYCTYWAPKVH